jgi:hypothetical protein
MGYYVRYISTRPEPLSLGAVQAMAGAIAPPLRLSSDGDLSLGNEVVAELEVNVPGDGLFDDEREELLEEVDARREEDEEGASLVRRTLEAATAIVAIRVLSGPRHGEEALEPIQPLLAKLAQDGPGLVQADGDGYSRGDELVLCCDD